MSEPTDEFEQMGADRAQRKRGRPPGSTSRKKRHLPARRLSPEPQTQLIPHKVATRYQDSVRTYEKLGMTQRVLQILRRIAGSRTFALETQRGPVLQQLIDVAKLLFLSELELVVWDLYLANTQWMGLPLSLQTLLVVAAYYVKSLMTSADSSYISTCLTKQIPQFQTGLSLWNTYCGPRYSVSPKALQARYQELMTPIKEDEAGTINYNFYVDEIINLGSMEDRTYMQTLQDYVPLSVPEQMSVPISPTKPVARMMMPLDTSYREDSLFSPLLSGDAFDPMTPMLIPYPFTYCTPPQSALPLLEDLNSAYLGPQADS